MVSRLIRKSVSITYRGVRTPLVAAVSRLPHGSRVRTGLHAVLQTVDARLNRTREPDRAGATRSNRAASAPTENAEAERAAVAAAVRERQPDEGELADPELAEVQAQLQAKHAVEEATQARRRSPRKAVKAKGT